MSHSHCHSKSHSHSHCCSFPTWRLAVESGVLASVPKAASLKKEAEECAHHKIGPLYTILVDATFLLAEPTIPGEDVTAVVILKEKIFDVGDANRILNQYRDFKKVSLAGQTVAPGFIEAHAHLIAAPQNQYMVDVGPQSCKSYQDVYNRIASDVAKASTGSWLLYQGYDPSLLEWTDQGFHQFDFTVFSTMPNQENVNIFVQNASGHIAYANSTAFATAQIKGNPPGGSYQTDSNGNFTGIMFEPPSFEPFLKKAPNAKLNLDQVLAWTSWLLGQAQQVGVTTFADPAIGLGGSLQGELDLYALLANDPNRHTDLVGSIDLTSYFPPDQASPHIPGLHAPSSPGATGSYYGLTIPAMKLWSDGTTQGYTAYLTEQYLPPVTPDGLPPYGSPDWSQSQLNTYLTQAKSDGWSILIHANGDKAIGMALDAIEKVYQAKSGYRTRIEHCTTATDLQYDRMQALGMTPTFLNNHVYIWGDTFYDHILGAERADRLDCASECVKRGMIFSFHCDYSVTLPMPLRYMQTAVTRTTQTGRVLGQQYAISALEALKGVTIYPAQQLGIDSTVGTIAAGKYANLVLLQQNPLTVPPDTIASIPVLGTYVRGKVPPPPPALPPVDFN